MFREARVTDGSVKSPSWTCWQASRRRVPRSGSCGRPAATCRSIGRCGPGRGFLDLCFTPRLAAEVTLQPIRRFGFDAAILFSDILVVPHALGQSVSFESGEGPRLDPIPMRRGSHACASGSIRMRWRRSTRRSGGSRRSCPKTLRFSGFAVHRGRLRPIWWQARGRDDQAPARIFAYADPDGFSRLIDLLVEASADYLARQLEAGVDAVQIFDTWAGVLRQDEFDRWCIAPTREIVASCVTGCRTRR